MNQDREDKIKNEAVRSEGTGQIPAVAGEDSRSEREISFTRRALIQAGWAVPTVLMFTFPDDASAISLHTDIPGPPHFDLITHIDN